MFQFKQRKGVKKDMAQTIGKGVEIEVRDSKAIITLDLTKNFGSSKTGKSTTVASTMGNVTIPGTSIKLGLNAYK